MKKSNNSNKFSNFIPNQTHWLNYIDFPNSNQLYYIIKDPLSIVSTKQCRSQHLSGIHQNLTHAQYTRFKLMQERSIWLLRGCTSSQRIVRRLSGCWCKGNWEKKRGPGAWAGNFIFGDSISSHICHSQIPKWHFLIIRTVCSRWVKFHARLLVVKYCRILFLSNICFSKC